VRVQFAHAPARRRFACGGAEAGAVHQDAGHSHTQ
jgi:hypothetical protein